MVHNCQMTWRIEFHDAFAQEFALWDSALRLELLAQTDLLVRDGPALGRPWVDTLSGSRFSNMKEIRFTWRGAPWRVAFAFDPLRQAILLVGGTKAGVNQRRFYRRLIRTADARYTQHLEFLQQRRTS